MPMKSSDELVAKKGSSRTSGGLRGSKADVVPNLIGRAGIS
jgi:hypothetical protein